ncbi:hypothetical protein HOP52_00890 [Halomonas campisalis]|uniref:Deoxynucleoside monophosphate kinase n=1 Tax=Billgrantia campisalis TaxID=74661 RepID=A0ABS9P3N0_9GAMM|nr:hypothetical protein [Halomonas campisalis]MCG6656334.1 hypothetical protein [Halomonas campisalis]MDR5861520.1 hypothetical protein [Halomonas campisalis]
MLVEFSAPPASGKSSIAKALSEDGYKLFRRSTHGAITGAGRASFYAKLLLSPAFVYAFVHRFFFFLSNYTGLSFRRKLISAFIAAQTNVLKRRKSWYVRDQGYFQLGDWVPPNMKRNPATLLKVLDDIGGMPNAVVFIDMPPLVVVEKLHRRGDFQKWEEKAKSLGFAGVLERLVDQKALDSVRYELCDIANIPYIIIKINDREEIFDVKYHCPNSVSDSLNTQIHALVESIKRHWRPFA